MGTKEQNRKYYLANKEAQAERNRLARKRNWDMVAKIKNETQCADCGVSYPHFVMDFDHLSDKVQDISLMCRDLKSVQSILDEIAKCEVVCSNCHRIRTFARR